MRVVYRRRRHPTRWRVTGFANISGVDVGAGFTRGSGAIMAADAIIHDTRVIKHDAYQPAIRNMTNIAFLGGWNMRCGFASGNSAIVTA